MELIKTLLEQQPLMALFLTIAIGYLVGEINVKGFSLGVGAVLFVALAMGWFAPKSVPSAMVGTLGLALFLYGVGVQYGTQFFIGLTSRGGLWANMIALTGVLTAGAVSLVFMKMMDLKLGHALGLFAGSGTSTAALQAAVATLGNDDPAVGYSVAYPFGVGGPILFLYIAFTLLKPKIQVPTGTGLELLEIAVRNPELSGKSLGELMTALPGGVQIVALRREGRNEPASPNFVIAENDVLLATAAPRKRSRRRARSWAKPPTATSSRTAGTSTICACLLPARRWWAEHWAISTCRGRRRPSSSRSAAAIPTSCRARISCWSSATASACSPIAAISRRCANTSATRSRAPPSSATSPSASAWRSAS